MGPRVGFACNWNRQPQGTWSGTPWHLRSHLRDQLDVVDLGLTVPVVPRAALKLASARPLDGRWVTPWKHDRPFERAAERLVAHRAARSGVDCVLEVQDLAPTAVPYFLYQDLSYEALLREWGDQPEVVARYFGLSMDTVKRRRDRQHRIYAGAAGIIVLSEWLAGRIRDWSDVPADRVHAVHPGATSLVDAAAAPPPERPGPRRRLLFVGRDFWIKGGDLVLAAVRRLRRTDDPQITLTVAGPARWPVAEPPGEGVRFIGPVARSQMPALYDAHDLFVMPSRLEGFGIVLAEALSRGLPCVGRNAFAMPEIIPAGCGALVDGDGPAELAAAIAGVLADDAVYARCSAGRHELARHFTWSRAAEEVAGVVRTSLS
jgi:glycosyltransferase involved in cell wall biosynthesis